MSHVGDDDHEAILGEARHGEISENPARVVAPLGVGHLTHGTRDSIGTEAIEDGGCIGALHEELRHERHVHGTDGLAHGAVLLCDPRAPESSAPGPRDLPLGFALGIEPLDELPPGRVGEVSSVRDPDVVQRRAANASRGVIVECRIATVTEEHTELFDDALGAEPP